jgi:hypothetical protein
MKSSVGAAYYDVAPTELKKQVEYFSTKMPRLRRWKLRSEEGLPESGWQNKVAEMKSLIVFFLAAFCASAQSPVPSLAEIKIAADAGDPAAQDKLAQSFIMRADTKQAEIWYRKAAEQGYTHAEGQLGNMMLMRSRMSVGLKPDARAEIGDEAVKWIVLAANQGDKRGQADFADIDLEGKLVKQDLVEAYKWGDLAAQGSMIDVATIGGHSTRDAAILKMDADQIAEARKRAAAFTPHQPQESELPEPSWVQKIKLNGIMGTPERRFVLINNQTFSKGDQASVKVGEKTVLVHCVEIHESSAVVSIDGIDGTRELKLP